jgi:hypothetical protein
MTSEELQAKLTEAQEELSRTRFFLHTLIESGTLASGLVKRYRCKVCGQSHFPEPVSECKRDEENKSYLESKKREREKYLTEFKAALKQATDERGESGWQFIDEYLKAG